MLCSSIVLSTTFAQELSLAKIAIQNYLDSWFESAGDEWLLEINGVKFPSYGMQVGLDKLEENLKNANVSKLEKEQIRERYIQTYIDQSVILALSYDNLIANPNLDILLQEFLRQASVQLWLETELAKEPSAIVPTDSEIAQYYQANSERLLRLGLSASQIKEFTEQELKQVKLQEWTYSKLAEVKSNNPATINPKFTKKYNIK